MINNDVDHHATPGLSFRFLVLMILALTMMAVDHRNPSMTSPVRTLFSIIGYPVQLMVDTPIRTYNATNNFFADHSQLSRENAELKKQLQMYSVKYRDMEILQQQNHRLRKLLNASQRESYTFAMAEVLSTSDDRGQNVVTLNKGRRDGVFIKQVVVGEGGGIYGQVIEVTPFNAKVMLITDIQHTIPVINKRTSEIASQNNGRGPRVLHALAEGTGDPGSMKLQSTVPASEKQIGDVREGDVFISSGFDGLFPEHFPVAVVVPNGVQYVAGDPFAEIKARPFVNIENTREVLLLWRNVLEPSGGELEGANDSENQLTSDQGDSEPKMPETDQ